MWGIIFIHRVNLKLPLRFHALLIVTILFLLMRTRGLIHEALLNLLTKSDLQRSYEDFARALRAY